MKEPVALNRGPVSPALRGCHVGARRAAEFVGSNDRLAVPLQEIYSLITWLHADLTGRR